jgi:hypothetical protein
MGALRERIARMEAVRNEIAKAVPDYEEFNAKVGHAMYKMEQGHDVRSRRLIRKYQKKLTKLYSDSPEPEKLSQIMHEFGRTTKFEHLEQVYGSDAWEELIAHGGTFPSTAWTDTGRHTWQDRRYRVSEFADREENGGWTVETIRDVARQDRADNLLYQDFIAQDEILDFELYCEARAQRAAHVLLNKMYKGAKLIAVHCESDAASKDESKVANVILHLYRRLCIAERRQRNENAKKVAKRKDIQFVAVEETPLPFDPLHETLEGASKSERLEVAMRAVPLLFDCCACHLAAAYGAPQKQLRSRVKALRAGITLLPDTGAATTSNTQKRAA